MKLLPLWQPKNFSIWRKKPYNKGMRYYLWILLLLFSGFTWGEEAEIVIEMIGTDTPAASKASQGDGVNLFTKNATQLKKLFRGKTREYVLYLAEQVSTQDEIIQSADGKEYALVRFGKDNTSYRKFLFKAQKPQTLLAVADDARSVVDLNTRYHVNISLSEKDFTNTYCVTPTVVTDMSANKEYHLYQLNEGPSFVFQDRKLVKMFTNPADFSAFATTLTAANTAYTADQERKQTALEKARLVQERREAARRRHRRPYKALLYGGTVEDRMYMPKVISTSTPLMPPPTPSKNPPGTPLVRDIYGNYMND